MNLTQVSVKFKQFETARKVKVSIANTRDVTCFRGYTAATLTDSSIIPMQTKGGLLEDQ